MRRKSSTMCLADEGVTLLEGEWYTTKLHSPLTHTCAMCSRGSPHTRPVSSRNYCPLLDKRTRGLNSQ